MHPTPLPFLFYSQERFFDLLLSSCVEFAGRLIWIRGLHMCRCLPGRKVRCVDIWYSLAPVYVFLLGRLLVPRALIFPTDSYLLILLAPLMTLLPLWLRNMMIVLLHGSAPIYRELPCLFQQATSFLSLLLVKQLLFNCSLYTLLLPLGIQY